MDSFKTEINKHQGKGILTQKEYLKWLSDQKTNYDALIYIQVLSIRAFRTNPDIVKLFLRFSSKVNSAATDGNVTEEILTNVKTTFNKPNMKWIEYSFKGDKTSDDEEALPQSADNLKIVGFNGDTPSMMINFIFGRF